MKRRAKPNGQDDGPADGGRAEHAPKPSKASRGALTHRSALERAVAALPTADDSTWAIPAATLRAAGLEADEAQARRFVLSFATWARGAVARLPAAPPELFEATDFNDYYKLVMSRIQFLYAQAVCGAPFGTDQQVPLCCFQTQVRRRPMFRMGGTEATSGVFDLRGSFRPPKPSVRLEGCLEDSRDAIRAALTAVGARRFRASTLQQLLTSASSQAEEIEASLAPLNDVWIRALDGKRLFTLLPEGADFSDGPDVEVRMHARARAPHGACARGAAPHTTEPGTHWESRGLPERAARAFPHAIVMACLGRR